MASENIQEVEIKSALDRNENGKAVIIPIIVRPCSWESSQLGKFQYLPKSGKPISNWENQDEALVEIAKDILAGIQSLKVMREGKRHQEHKGKTRELSITPEKQYIDIKGMPCINNSNSAYRFIKKNEKYIALLFLVPLLIWGVARMITYSGSAKTSKSVAIENGVVKIGDKEYHTIRLNNLIWMSENLDYEIEGASWCCGDSVKNCAKYGRLYTWKSAKDACAALGDRWRLPSTKEWQDLEEIYKDADNKNAVYEALIFNGIGQFNAQLGGYRDSDGKFYENGTVGYYWAGSKDENTPQTAHSYNFYLKDKESSREDEVDKAKALSCRCVKSYPF